MTETPFRLAVLQSPGHLSGPRARLDWLAGELAGAAGSGAHLVLLPELFATGYNVGDAVRALAEPADGPISHEIRALAQRHGLTIHYGYAEASGGAICNSAQCFGPDGAQLTHHRKQLLPPGFEPLHFSPGSGFTMFRFRGLTFATLICYEIEFCETARHVAGQGAEVILVPTALGAQWGWVARQMVPTRAFENGVFLAYANHAGSEAGLDYLGESFIAAPDGEELARAGGAPGLIVADIARARVGAAQRRLPYLQDRSRLVLD